MMLNPRSFGAAGDGSDATQAFQDWFGTVTNHGQHGYIPDGAYLLTSTISNISCTKDFKITAAPGAVIYGAAGMSVPMFNIRGRVSVDWSGGTYDFSQGRHIPGAQSSTCLAFGDLETLSISKAKFTGALNDYRDETADSAITELNTKHGTISEIHATGFSDNAVYLSGSGDPGPQDNGLGFTVRDSYFDRNKIAVSSRRDRRGTRFINNTCESNQIDFFEVHIATLGSAQRSIVSGNHSKNCMSRPINLRGSVGGIITDNVLEDFGYDLEGSIVTAARGIMLQGCSETIVSNNNIRMHAYPTQPNLMGISFEEYTIDGDVRAAMDNLVNGNIITDMNIGINEIGASGPNYGIGNLIRDTVNPLSVNVDSNIGVL